MRDLEEVRKALVAELGGEDRLPLVNARVILRTGVNLTKLDPRKVADQQHTSRVVAALREMGFILDGKSRGVQG